MKIVGLELHKRQLRYEQQIILLEEVLCSRRAASYFMVDNTRMCREEHNSMSHFRIQLAKFECRERLTALNF